LSGQFAFVSPKIAKLPSNKRSALIVLTLGNYFAIVAVCSLEPCGLPQLTGDDGMISRPGRALHVELCLRLSGWDPLSEVVPFSGTEWRLG
jgi:hypothetical protein